MAGQYSQITAMLAITKASLRAIFRSPSAVVFSFAFPLIFILVFGFIGGGGRVSFRIAVDKNCDTINTVYTALKSVPGVTVVNKNDKEIREDLEKGRLTAILNIQKSRNGSTPYIINLKTSEAVNSQNLQVLQS